MAHFPELFHSRGDQKLSVHGADMVLGLGNSQRAHVMDGVVSDKMINRTLAVKSNQIYLYTAYLKMTQGCLQ